MKKILFYCFSFMLLVTSCEIDNYDGPNARFYGKILDAETGELVGTDIENGSIIKVYEQGWSTPTAQNWYIQNTGEFRNDLVFAATYDIVFENGNFYPFTVDNFVIKAGDNEHDFKVTPYIRVKNASITREGNQIKARFSLDVGKPEVKVKEIQLFAHTDIWVGNNVKYSLTGDNVKQSFSPSQEIVSSTQYELNINVDDNKDSFKYNKKYYFRIGALADVSGVGTVRYNYSPLVTIQF